MHDFQFITAIPWNVHKGSGCYVGTRTLIEGVRKLGVTVRLIIPQIVTPVFTATRVLFNETLRRRRFDCLATVGIDVDGYAVPHGIQSPPHIACIKGVLGDAVRFESGVTRASLAFQAALEKRNARRADLVITISRYCAQRVEELYGVRGAVVVPELIDLNTWRSLFQANSAASPGQSSKKFIVLSVCRFYPRKRIDVLLRAASLLRQVIPPLEIRIVGDGPERPRLHGICRDLNLGSTVEWLGDLSRSALAAEYKRCDMFCLPSVQEGFGIVILEAMAAAKPIVAARAAAIPELLRNESLGNGNLADPDSPESLAENIRRLYRDPDLRHRLGASGLREVEQYDVKVVAGRFISEVAKVAPELRRYLKNVRQQCEGTIRARSENGDSIQQPGRESAATGTL